MSTVLVVDDSRADRLLIGNLLRNSHLETAFAVDGEHALQTMHQETPHLVITDWVMPNLDGLELTAAIVKSYPLVPVILTTGKGNDRIAVQALSAGASNYLPKNMLHDRLLDSVEGLLAMALDDRSQPDGTEPQAGFQFSIDNDVAKLPALIGRIRRLLRRANLCDESDGIRICVALEEALNNALYHGNLELDSQLREEDRRAFRALVEARRAAPPYRDRRIHVAVSLAADHGSVVIRDEGQGFDAASLPDPTAPANLERPSGRGLLLMRTFMDEVRYNSVGNEVTLIKRRQPTNPGPESEVCECASQNTLPSNTRMKS